MTVVRTPAGEGGGPTIYVEVEAPTSSSWGDDAVRGDRAEKVATAAKDLLGEGVDLARTCAVRFSTALAQMPHGVRAPTTVELQLGITLDGELGAVLAKAKGGAQLQITMTWERPS